MVVPKPCYSTIVNELMRKKDAIEERINTHGLTLRRNNVGMTESVVDEHGFPRSDIDVYQVREARHQIICLQNDLKEVMKAIEQGLYDLHAVEEVDEAGSKASTKMARVYEAVNEEDYTNFKPFIRVDVVSKGSPAEQAEFRVNDEIVMFGSVNATNFRGLAHIAEIVKNCEDKMMMVIVLRNAKPIELELIPHRWNGRGLLGCNMVLCDNVDR